MNVITAFKTSHHIICFAFSGFDVAGTIERVPTGNNSNFSVGDRVFGCTLFGAYSNRVVIPTIQLRKIPDCIDSFSKAASFPAVSLTALYALHLAGYFPGGVDEGGSREKMSQSDADRSNELEV